MPLFDPPKASELPPLNLLDDPPPREPAYSAEALEAHVAPGGDQAQGLRRRGRSRGRAARARWSRASSCGPRPGVKASQITSLAKDLARALSVISVRVVEVIPGKTVMGLEIPNEKREIVTLGRDHQARRRTTSAARRWRWRSARTSAAQPVVADLARMPHLLIAGTTGSGKSVGINAMVLSLLYKSTAEHVRLIMIDPKMLELSVYEGIPHLLAPVVTDMKQAANALRWCVAEMERRYQLMSALGVRNIAGFNRKVKDANDAGKPIRDPVMTAARVERSDVRPEARFRI